MISVIVPVYMVEEYLDRCIKSILGQSYKELEILLIDDGSCDCSGEICDYYSKLDHRVKVFHIDNKGLSGARNYGLKNAQGEYIGFIDSDDWIDPNMYELLVNGAIEYDADVVECGFFDEYTDHTVIKKEHKAVKVYKNTEAVTAHLYGEINSLFMTKLWKKKCFQVMHFPEGHVFEDTSMIYKILEETNVVLGIRGVLYHHRIRKDSISHSDDLHVLTDSWNANKNQYLDIKCKEPYCHDIELLQHLLHNCAGAFFSIWRRYYKYTKEERVQHRGLINEINAFVRQFYPLFGFSSWSMKYRMAVFLAHFNNELSLMVSYLLSSIVCRSKETYT